MSPGDSWRRSVAILGAMDARSSSSVDPLCSDESDVETELPRLGPRVVGCPAVVVRYGTADEPSDASPSRAPCP